VACSAPGPRASTAGSSKPQRHLGRLHRLLDHRQQLSRQRVQVDLVPEAGAERRDRAGGVVAAPVEAPVDRGLDAAAGRLEHPGDRQRRGGHDQAGLPAEELAEPQDHPGVTQAEQDREQPVGERAADDAVQVVQPVAHDRRADRQRQDRQADTERHAEQGRGTRGAQRQGGQDDHRRGRGGRRGC